MRWGSRHPRFGAQDCYTPSFVRRLEGGISIATKREFEDGAGFFDRFDGALSVRDLTDKDVLDIGCGHGGRTAYYVRHGGPRSIVGLEVSHDRASVADASSRRLCDGGRISFTVGFGEEMPFKDDSFDLLLSYDVFEHVADLRMVLEECFRVLRPEGCLYALFPPYYGPRAHHLDFITTLPFLHHVFSPRVLVSAANQILKEQPELRDYPVADPRRSYLGREVLPGMNGTTERDVRRLIAGLSFEKMELTLVPFASGPGGRMKRAVRLVCAGLVRLPWPFTRDVFASTIRCILRKPKAPHFSRILPKREVASQRKV